MVNHKFEAYPTSAKPLPERESSLSAPKIFPALFLLGAHFALALIIRNNSILSTLHAVLAIGIGLLFALIDKKPYRTIYIIGYIAGAEMLWRATHAQIFWETGKYAVAMLTIVGLLRSKNSVSVEKRPFFYFVLLLPSILVMPSFDRTQIAFNLAGPFALATATMFFSVIKLDKNQVGNLLLAILAPIITMGGLTVLGIINAETIIFGQGSLFVTSADIGPNQVSSILGLGALVAFLSAVLTSTRRMLRLTFILVAIWLLTQTALTFSRGGFWTALIAIIASTFYLIRERRTRNAFLLASILMLPVMNLFVYPALTRFTSGAITERFSDYGSTGRIEIIKSDLKVFTEYPVFGVGPHQSKPYHALYFRYSSAHTEYSRMLSEHGSFGVMALLIMLWLVLSRINAKMAAPSKSLTIAFLVWALLFMSHAATRLAAPSLLFGLAFTKFEMMASSDETNDIPS